jgi:uncharacterized protein
MKFLLILALVFIGMWMWRSARQDKESSQKPPAPPSGPQEMVSCTLCGLHFPQADGVQGRKGLYCSTEHRKQAES